MQLREIEKDLASFKEWLLARGAQVLEPTSEWEVLRFRCATSTSIIYKDAKGKLSLQGRSAEAYNAFRKAWRWDAGVRKHRGSKKRGQFIAALVKRDGYCCFYCGNEMLHDQVTLEHLVPLSAGGPDHLANLALACGTPCNQMAGHLSMVEKVKLRDKIRADQCKKMIL